MHRSKWLIALLVIILLGGMFSTVYAQDYSFSVPKADVVASVNQDGTVTVDYTYTFQNNPGAHVIDYVDIGIPAGAKYDLGSITADVNGQKITDIAVSDYVANAVALGLGSNSIPAGGSGTVHVTMPNMSGLIYPATEKESEAYASFQFQPNYFGGVTGNTDMAVTLILPPGVTEQEPRYYPPDNWPGTVNPGSGYTADNRIFYTWEATNAKSGSQYIFGTSFPARVIPAEAISKAPSSGSSSGPSTSPSGPATITFNDSLCTTVICLGFIGIFGLSIYGSIVASRKRKLQYMPPKISVEGHGIKRGLTPIEVAILMEQPMDKIMTMILFSVLKKEAAEVTNRDPLTLKVADPRPEGLYEYETTFLDAFKVTAPAERRKLLQDVMVNLVKSVTEKMKGFSAKETIAYYDDIMKRAWEQVETAQTPEIKGETFEEVLPWTMLDKRYEERTRGAFGTGPVFVPNWWWRYDPTLRGPILGSGTAGGGTSPISTGVPSSSGGGSRTIQLPNLPGADFAASVVNGVQSFSAGVLGNLTDFTGGITNRTNPAPKPTSTSTFRGPGGGGGHCACACACACAGCACACAGGGR